MDDDGDGVLDSVDQRPLDASEAFDFDGDGIGDNADTDDDDDGYSDAEDAFPLNPLDWTDTDKDDVGDNTDAFGLDPGLQSLAVDDALGFVTDPSLLNCLTQSTQGMVRAQELTYLYCSYQDDRPPVLNLSGIEHFFMLEHIQLVQGAPVSLDPLAKLNALKLLEIGNVPGWQMRDFSPLKALYNLRDLSWDHADFIQADDYLVLERLHNLTAIGFGRSESMVNIEFLRQFPRLQRVGIQENAISDFSPIGDLEHLLHLNIYKQRTLQLLDVSFLRANRELLSFSTHMGIAGERVFLYLDKLKVFATGWSGSPDQPHQFSEYTNLDFLMNAVGLEQISVENYGLSDFLRLSSFPNLKKP